MHLFRLRRSTRRATASSRRASERRHWREVICLIILYASRSTVEWRAPSLVFIVFLTLNTACRTCAFFFDWMHILIIKIIIFSAHAVSEGSARRGAQRDGHRSSIRATRRAVHQWSQSGIQGWCGQRNAMKRK